MSLHTIYDPGTRMATKKTCLRQALSSAHSPGVLWRMSWDSLAWGHPLCSCHCGRSCHNSRVSKAPLLPPRPFFLLACNKWKQRCTLTRGKWLAWIIAPCAYFICIYIFIFMVERKWGICGSEVAWKFGGAHTTTAFRIALLFWVVTASFMPPPGCYCCVLKQSMRG